MQTYDQNVLALRALELMALAAAAPSDSERERLTNMARACEERLERAIKTPVLSES